MKANRTGPKTLTGSREAKRIAAVLLEVLSGERGPHEGSTALGISLSRYYVLETRALQGMISALEPQPRGRRKGPEDRIAELEREGRRLSQDLVRMQALLRASQRSLGLPSHRRTGRGKVVQSLGKRKRRRRIVRAKSAIAVLQPETAREPSS